ncbi:MAG: hypothetical protein WEE89_01265 [Gemmatimonadota bacterium]
MAKLWRSVWTFIGFRIPAVTAAFCTSHDRSVNRNCPPFLSREEVKPILTAPHHIKHRAILTVIVFGWVVVGEAVRLNSDVDFDRKQIHVRGGKGGKDRYSLLADACVICLQEFVPRRASGWRFPGARSDRHIPFAASKRSCKRAIPGDVGYGGPEISPHSMPGPGSIWKSLDRLVQAGTIECIPRSGHHAHVWTTTGAHVRHTIVEFSGCSAEEEALHQAARARLHCPSCQSRSREKLCHAWMRQPR